MSQATFKIWRGGGDKPGQFVDYRTEVSEGMVVLDAVHRVQAEQAPDLACRWNCKAGKCGSCSAEINGRPKLMCMTRLNTLDLNEPVTVEPMRAFPLIKDLVTDVSFNFRAKPGIKKFAPRKPDAPDGPGAWRSAMSIACRNSGSASSAFSARTCVTSCAITASTRKPDSSARATSSTPRPSRMHPLDTGDRLGRFETRAGTRLLQHHEVLHDRVPGAHSHHRQCHHSAQRARRRSVL
jgi:succinate dehydrogenase / fumarate reductase iron-sulfur subunit